jgi:glycosyltransferase involved in cell wall biosynthesis
VALAGDDDPEGQLSSAAASGPHVLYVAWGFPPSRGGGVYRALATANGLSRQGFSVTVLTATRETFLRHTGADLSLEAEVDPAIRVVRIPFDWPIMETDVRTWPLTRALHPAAWRKARIAADLAVFPEPSYGPWRPALERAAREIHAERPVDLVVATANPNVDFVPAEVLHRAHGVPYVMDYRDAWLLDVFTGEQLHSDDSDQAEVEARLMAGAREVWFVNESIRSWHQERYPATASRMKVVSNGFDPEFAPEPRLQPPPADRPLTFGYIGTVSSKVPLAEFAEGWALARSSDPALASATARVHGYLGFYGTASPRLAALFRDEGNDGLIFGGPVPKAQVREAYAGFDALLLILGKGKHVTSGKVFEYAASALPIVAVHDPGNAATDVLRDYPLWFPVTDLSAESISDALIAAGTSAREASAQTRAACAAFARRYERDRQLQPRLAELFRSSTDRGGRQA